MKKSARKSKKNVRYNGKNIFGERCVAKFVTFEKETAISQYLDILADLDANKGKRIEYTIAYSENFTEDELRELDDKMAKLTQLWAAAKETSFVALDPTLSGICNKRSLDELAVLAKCPQNKAA